MWKEAARRFIGKLKAAAGTSQGAKAAGEKRVGGRIIAGATNAGNRRGGKSLNAKSGLMKTKIVEACPRL